MSDAKSNVLENDLLKLIFNATPISNIADDAASAPLTELWVSLHTASPGEAGNQTSNEATYGGYGRKAVARSTLGWTVTNNNVSPNADVAFAEATLGLETITHFGIGTASSGSGKLLYYGVVTPNLSVAVSVKPTLTPAMTITEN